MDNNKENVAEQKSQRELSDASTVKTPLVDALRCYFASQLNQGTNGVYSVSGIMEVYG